MIKSTENIYVGSLIAGDVPFVIPKYQRPYAWEEDQIKDFIGDIKDLYTERMNNPFSPNRRKHFFGGIISIYRETPHSYDTMRTYDLVDGQQRFATLMITIALLVHGLNELAKYASISGEKELSETAKFHAETLKEKYLEYKKVVGNKIEGHVRLKLSNVDAAFFESLVRGNSGILLSQGISEKASHKRLQDAWSKINDELVLSILNRSDLNISEKLNHFRVLGNCILEDCYLIHISSDDMGEAYRLFAILNDRGKTLSEGDLLRVYTLEMLEQHPIQQSHIENDWDEILGHSYEEVKQFLRAYYPSFKGDRAPGGDFADKFREYFFNYDKKPLPPTQAVEVVARVGHMKKEIDVFLALSDGDWPYDVPESSLSERVHLSYLIKALKHTLSLPLLMSAYQALSETDFAKLVDLLSRFSFRYINIVGVHPASLQNIYYKYAVILRDEISTFDMSRFQADLAKLQKANAPDKLFEEAMRQKLNYKMLTKNYIRYFLITIEEYIKWYRQGASGKPTIMDTTRIFDFEKCTIEHIYSQKSTPSDPVLEPMKQDIGNLSFWGANENAKVGNKPFADKKSFYQQSSVLLNQELAALSTWDRATLEWRREELIKIALTIFSA